MPSSKQNSANAPLPKRQRPDRYVQCPCGNTFRKDHSRDKLASGKCNFCLLPKTATVVKRDANRQCYYLCETCLEPKLKRAFPKDSDL